MCKGLLALNMEFTVLTNSLRVLNELSKSPKIHLIAVGGRYDKNEQAFLGPTASNYLRQFQVDRAFFSCKSFDDKRGLSVADERVADMLRTVIDCAEQPCLLAEHSMFGKASFAWFGSFDDLCYVFTDQKVDDNWRDFSPGSMCACLNASIRIEPMSRTRRTWNSEDRSFLIP